MAAKGTIEAGAAVTNHFRFEIFGIVPIPVTRIGELTREIVMAEMPDQTMQTTGQVKPGDSDFDVPAHHDAAVAGLNALMALNANGVVLGKVPATLYILGADNTSVKRSVLLDGFAITGLKTPELNSGDDGEMVAFTYSFSYDNLVFLP